MVKNGIITGWDYSKAAATNIYEASKAMGYSVYTGVKDVNNSAGGQIRDINHSLLTTTGQAGRDLGNYSAATANTVWDSAKHGGTNLKEGS